MSSSGSLNWETTDVSYSDDMRRPGDSTRAVDSPLGHLDPSRITHMVVDQVCLRGDDGHNNDRFVVPDPPHQSWSHSSPASSPSVTASPSKVTDTCQKQSHMGTPTNVMHMQQGAVGSPTLNSEPVTPQQAVHQQQTFGQRQTESGQYRQSVECVPQRPNLQCQGYSHGASDTVGDTYIQREALGGGSGVQDNCSPSLYARQQQMMEQQQQQLQMMNRQQQQQHIIGHQQPMISQQVMVSQQTCVVGGNSAVFYPQQSPQAQWTQQHHQQQMQQAHFVRQSQMILEPGQRVMVQRMPYPPAYPTGMQAASQQQQQLQSAVAVQQGGQPSGAPPSQVQRPTYPPGTAQQPQPQYGYPSGPSVGYPQPQPSQAVAYQQQQMYQMQQHQVPQHQQMRPYASPQGAVVTPTQQGMYAAGATPQPPQTPQTPQTPYTPNGTRFSQPTPSPHCATDLRSPSLMSPTQASVPPQSAISRPLSNGEVVTQPIRMVPVQQQPMMPSQFFTYEPNFLMNVHPDMCLVGCVLHMFDVERMFTDKLDLPNVVLAIRMHGGDIEFGAKTYAERAGVITHVIVESIRTQHAHLALKDRKRLVTMQWLVDVLMKKQMDVPWRHAHLPSLFVDGCRPLQGKLISFSGFDESERAAMKFMVEAMGAKFTPYLSRHNNILIAKTAGADKVEKAREWDIQVVNYQWLADNYAGQKVDADSQRYQAGQPCEGVSPGPYVLEMINDHFKQLLLAWKVPVIVSPEQWRRSFDMKQAVENDEGVFPNKKLRMQSAPPTEEEIAARAEELKKAGDSHPAYVVAFSGIDDENKHILTQKLRFLGGRACEEVSECTHLVTTTGRRTEKLLEAICLGKNIVNPYWIVHGYECRQWMDTLDYFLHDEDQEKHLGYNCKRSVVRARHRKVFEDVQFYITPSVEPSREVLTRLIRLAGGIVHEERPAPAHIARCIETDAPYIVISCECDLRMVQYLLECNFPVYNTDMVLIALMRQEIQPHPMYRVNTSSVTKPVVPQLTPGQPQARPVQSRASVEQQQQAHRVKA